MSCLRQRLPWTTFTCGLRWTTFIYRWIHLISRLYGASFILDLSSTPSTSSLATTAAVLARNTDISATAIATALCSSLCLPLLIPRDCSTSLCHLQTVLPQPPSSSSPNPHADLSLSFPRNPTLRSRPNHHHHLPQPTQHPNHHRLHPLPPPATAHFASLTLFNPDAPNTSRLVAPRRANPPLPRPSIVRICHHPPRRVTPQRRPHVCEDDKGASGSDVDVGNSEIREVLELGEPNAGEAAKAVDVGEGSKGGGQFQREADGGDEAAKELQGA